MIKEARLKKKIRKAHEVIEDALGRFAEDKIALAWTGGKDSTLLLWLARDVYKAKQKKLPHLLFINEGDLFPEVKRFVKTLSKDWNLIVRTVQNEDVLKQAHRIGSKILVSKLSANNKKELSRLGFDKDSFPFEPESYVGNHLMKTVPMNEYLGQKKMEALITGIRKDEQEARSKETYFSKRLNPDHFRVHPILDFTEQDVWDSIHTYDIPYVELYNQGYRSLGAKSTTQKVTSIPAWKQDLKNTKEREGRRQDKEKIMEKLRKLGYM